MDKLLELEKKLKEAKAELEKNGTRFSGMAGSVATSGGPSIASQIGFGKAEDDKEKKKEKKNPDEKADADLGEEVEHAVERHFEENADAEEKEGHKLKIEKSQKDGNKFGNKAEAFRTEVMHSARQPATVTDMKTGAKTLSTPKDQIKAKADKAASNKAKFEAEAAERRSKMRSEGVLKGEDNDLDKATEEIKIAKNGQWSL